MRSSPAAVLPRVLVVADNASDRFGGEASLPLAYFVLLRRRGVDVRLVTHSRVREELLARLPEESARLHFVEDSLLQKIVWWTGMHLPPRMRYFTIESILRFTTQHAQRRLARRLVAAHGIDVVHQPTPVSPREPSLLAGLGAPVVIGPMNCAVDYPREFRGVDLALTRGIVRFGRALAPFLDRLFPGKREAALLLVANERSRAALVGGGGARVAFLPENGVDLAAWQPGPERPRERTACRFAFVGRLIATKGVHLLLEAFERALAQEPGLSVLVVGDGPELARLRALAAASGILAGAPDEPGRIHFAGWRSREEVVALLREQDGFVFPTLFECGGVAVLEAMALRLPVIASGWGGPADYVDPSCGVLVAEPSPARFVESLADAMLRLARDPELRARMGRAGRAKVERLYTWDGKIDRMLDFYRSTLRRDGGETR
jgi:glycosyltransferase involved in cell wall biosynthesis